MSIGVSIVSICNMALSHVTAKDRIQDILEKGPEARECRTWYDASRRSTLEAFNWNFARRQRFLSLHSDDPATNWGFRYQTPSDMLAPRLIVNPAGPTAERVPFELATSLDGNTLCINTNMPNAELIYTFDQQSTALFTALFVEAMSHHLAYNIALPLTGKKEIRDTQRQMWSDMISTASANDANQQAEHRPKNADWIEGR